MEFEITKMNEKGQIVIPQEFIEHMGLHKGEKFIIIERENMLILKRLKAHTREEFETMIKKGHLHAKKHKLTKKDLENAIKRVRKK